MNKIQFLASMVFASVISSCSEEKFDLKLAPMFENELIQIENKNIKEAIRIESGDAKLTKEQAQNGNLCIGTYEKRLYEDGRLIAIQEYSQSGEVQMECKISWDNNGYIAKSECQVYDKNRKSYNMSLAGFQDNMSIQQEKDTLIINIQDTIHSKYFWKDSCLYSNNKSRTIFDSKGKKLSYQTKENDAWRNVHEYKYDLNDNLIAYESFYNNDTSTTLISETHKNGQIESNWTEYDYGLNSYFQFIMNHANTNNFFDSVLNDTGFERGCYTDNSFTPLPVSVSNYFFNTDRSRKSIEKFELEIRNLFDVPIYDLELQLVIEVQKGFGFTKIFDQNIIINSEIPAYGTRRIRVNELNDFFLGVDAVYLDRNYNAVKTDFWEMSGQALNVRVINRTF